MTKRLLLICLTWVWLGLTVGTAVAVEIQVRASRDPAPMDESFQLLFSASEEPDGEPDFTPLRQDFELLGQSQSSQMSILNGHYQRSIQWEISVMAKRAGTLTVPAIAFGHDRSTPLNLQVDTARASTGPRAAPNADADKLVFIEVEANPRNPYVQAQVIYTLRVWSQVGLHNAHLEEPKLDNAVIERLGSDSQYSTQRDGRQYHVVERRFAIFPQHSGHVVIDAPSLEAEMGGFGSQSVFSRFLIQPNDTHRRVRGQNVELEVRPIPAQFSGQHWLPARQLSLSEELNPRDRTLQVGEPLTRTLTLHAEGSTVGNLPELNTTDATGLSAYPDQPNLSENKTSVGLSAVRSEKIAYLATQAGNYNLPEIRIPWWNTESDREEIAQLPAHPLESVGHPATPNTSTPPAVQMNADAAAPASAPSVNVTPSSPAATHWLWIGLAAFCAVGWLTTALVWWRQRNRHAAPKLDAPNAETLRATGRAFKQACRTNNAPSARQALLAWAQTQWPEQTPRHLDEVARLGGAALAAEIDQLNRASYSSTHTAWNGRALLNAWQTIAEPTSLKGNEVLEPLYKT